MTGSTAGHSNSQPLPLPELGAHCHAGVVPSGLVFQARGSFGLVRGEKEPGGKEDLAVGGLWEWPPPARAMGCPITAPLGWWLGHGCPLSQEAATPSLVIHGLCPDTLMPQGEPPPLSLCGPLAWYSGQELEPRLRYELQEKRVPARKKEHIESLIKAPANCQGRGLAARLG